MQTIMVNVKKVIDPNNYRKSMNKEAFEELVASIRAKGILQQLLVRKKNGKYEIIAGKRRFKGAVAAGLKDVPVVVKDVTDEEALELSIIENSQREDPDLIDEADGFNRLISLGKHTPETISDKTGKSIKYVLGRLKLAGLPKDIKKKIASGEIGTGHALLFTRLKNTADMQDFYKRITDGFDRLTVSEAEDALGQYSTKLSNAKFDLKGCEKCPARTKNQAQMFPEIKDSDECMDNSCFKGKSFDFYRTHYAKLKDEGFKVLTDEKEVKTALAGKHSREINPDAWDKPKKYKSMCKKCKETHAYYLIIAKDNMGDKQALRGEICLDVKCYNKMNGRREASDSGNGSGLPKKDNSYARDEKARHARDRFLHAELPGKVKEKIYLIVRLAIFHILDRFKNNNAVIKLIKENCTDNKKGLYHALMTIPEKKLAGVLNKTVLLSIRFTDSDVLLQAAPEAGMDVHRDFRMDELFLQTKTKAELLTLAKTFKIFEAGQGLEDSMKKGDMVSSILKHDLTGKLTPELKESFNFKADLDDDLEYEDYEEEEGE